MADSKNTKDLKTPTPSASDAEIAAKAQNIEKIIEELRAEFSGNVNLGAEIDQLAKISAFAESVTKKLIAHYAHVFPKKCNNCGTVYKTREEYLSATQRLAKTTTVFDVVGLQEYRNCPCGSTLIVWTQDRRDNTEYGVARRKLFDECMEKMKQMSGESDTVIREKLRKLFSSIAA